MDGIALGSATGVSAIVGDGVGLSAGVAVASGVGVDSGTGVADGVQLVWGGVGLAAIRNGVRSAAARGVRRRGLSTVRGRVCATATSPAGHLTAQK